MRTFRIAYTGDFLDRSGRVAVGDAGLPLLEGLPFVSHRFLTGPDPEGGDASSWERSFTGELTPDQIAGVDGLVVLRPGVRESTFARGAADLVVIGRCGAGYDKVDLAACTANDVALFNAPMAVYHSTASAALLFLLALAKRLPEQQRITHAANWGDQARVTGSELPGRTLGIVGLGHSGREFARLVAPFEMRLLSYSPHAEPRQAEALGVQLTSLEELLRESDFVSLHCRLSPETRHLIGAGQLALMKPSAFLINIARGEVVDQPALVEALRSRRIAGAGLDVFEVEPIPAGDPLLELDNVILTPHWLASTTDVWQATGRAMAEGMIRAARGMVPEAVVNREVLDRPGFRAKLARFAENGSGAVDR